MIIPGLSSADGIPKKAPKPFIDGPAPKRDFGHFIEGEDELNELWDNGQIDKIGLHPAPPTAEPIDRSTKTYEVATGRSFPSAPHYYKQPQPTIFGPIVVFSNILELRRRYT